MSAHFSARFSHFHAGRKFIHCQLPTAGCHLWRAIATTAPFLTTNFISYNTFAANPAATSHTNAQPSRLPSPGSDCSLDIMFKWKSNLNAESSLLSKV